MSWFGWWSRPAPVPPEIPVLPDTTEYLPFSTYTLCPKCGSAKLTSRYHVAGQVAAREGWNAGDVFPHVVAWMIKKERLEIKCVCGFSWVTLPADGTEAGRE